MRGRTFLGTLLALAGCGADPQIDAARDAVRQRLTDPDSAQFRDIEGCAGDTLTGVLRGEYNAKNRMGGYNGFQAFFFADGQVELGDEIGGPLFKRCMSEMAAHTATIVNSLPPEYRRQYDQSVNQQ